MRNGMSSARQKTPTQSTGGHEKTPIPKNRGSIFLSDIANICPSDESPQGGSGTLIPNKLSVHCYSAPFEGV